MLSGLHGFPWALLYRCRRVHSGVRGFTLGITWFGRVRVDSLRSALGSPDSLGFAWVLTGVPISRRFDWGSCRFIMTRLCVVGFIGVRVG